ncbi:MAG: ABC transporter substrate-binding protein [Phycisphaerales bacterium]
MILPRPLVAAPFLALSALLAACSGNDPGASIDSAQGGAATPALTKVKLQLNWVAEPEFGGFYAAEQKALFQAEGLEVELVQGGPGVPAPQLAASGKVEFAIVSGPQVVELAEQGGDLIALFAVYQHNPMGVMVHQSSPYQSLAELWQSESTVSVEQGLAEFAWLSKQYPEGKLRIVPYTSNLAGFAADAKLAQQCFITSEPVSLELQGVKTRLFMFGESGFDPYNAVVATTRQYYEANKATCAALVRACAAGWRAYLDDPKPFNETMSRLNAAMSIEAMNMGAEKQRALIENEETKRLGLGGMRMQRWQLVVEQLSDIGRIKSRPDATRLFVWDTEAGTAR